MVLMHVLEMLKQLSDVQQKNKENLKIDHENVFVFGESAGGLATFACSFTDNENLSKCFFKDANDHVNQDTALQHCNPDIKPMKMNHCVMCSGKNKKRKSSKLPVTDDERSAGAHTECSEDSEEDNSDVDALHFYKQHFQLAMVKASVRAAKRKMKKNLVKAKNKIRRKCRR